jgi:hypothetical protein
MKVHTLQSKDAKWTTTFKVDSKNDLVKILHTNNHDSSTNYEITRTVEGARSLWRVGIITGWVVLL